MLAKKPARPIAFCAATFVFVKLLSDDFNFFACIVIYSVFRNSADVLVRTLLGMLLLGAALFGVMAQLIPAAQCLLVAAIGSVGGHQLGFHDLRHTR